MAELDHERIRVLAYELWEQDGSPEGRSDECWHRAVEILSVEENSPTGDDPTSALPASSVTPKPVT